MIVVLHGFASAGGEHNDKFLYLREQFKDTLVLGPSYKFNGDVAINSLSDEIEQTLSKNPQESIVFVGTSLGGFIARYLAKKFDGKAVLINPSIDPANTLKVYRGRHKNYKTGEKFTMTLEDCESFRHYYVNSIVPTLVLLDKGDELFDYQNTVEYFKDIAKVVTFEGGSHRFEHIEESVPYIRELLNNQIQ